MNWKLVGSIIHGLSMTKNPYREIGKIASSREDPLFVYAKGFGVGRLMVIPTWIVNKCTLQRHLLATTLWWAYPLGDESGSLSDPKIYHMFRSGFLLPRVSLTGSGFDRITLSQANHSLSWKWSCSRNKQLDCVKNENRVSPLFELWPRSLKCDVRIVQGIFFFLTTLRCRN